MGIIWSGVFSWGRKNVDPMVLGIWLAVDKLSTSKWAGRSYAEIPTHTVVPTPRSPCGAGWRNSRALADEASVQGRSRARGRPEEAARR